MDSERGASRWCAIVLAGVLLGAVACGREGAPGSEGTPSAVAITPIPPPDEDIPLGVRQAIGDWLRVPDGARVYSIRELRPGLLGVPFTWTDARGLNGGLALVVQDETSWQVDDESSIAIPPDGHVSRGFSSLVPLESEGALVIGGFVDPSATAVKVLGAQGEELDVQTPSAASVVLVVRASQPAQIRLESGSGLLAATSIPLIDEIAYPSGFAVNPPDWRESAKELVRALASGSGASTVVHPDVSASIAEDLGRLLGDAPQIISVEGQGGSYVINLRSVGTCREVDETCTATLYLYLAPVDGEPMLVGYDFRPSLD